MKHNFNILLAEDNAKVLNFLVYPCFHCNNRTLDPQQTPIIVVLIAMNVSEKSGEHGY